MVSAGFTAAEVGRKLASTTKRFGWSCARQKMSTTLVAGSVPIRAVPHWCDGVRRSNGFDSTSGNPARRSTALSFATSASCASQFDRRQSKTIRSPSTVTRLRGIGQVLAHRVEVDRVAREPAAPPGRGNAAGGGEDAAGNLAEELHVAERRAVRPAGQVEVIDEQGLLVDRVVAAERMHRQHRRAVVVHEVPPDLVGAVGEPRAQQQHGGVRPPRPQGPRAPPTAAAPRRPADTRPRRSAPSAPASRRVTSAPVSSVTFGCFERGRDPDRLAVALGAGRVGKGVPGRRRPLQPAVEVDPERQRRRRDAGRLQPRPHVGDARLVRHRRKRIASRVSRLGRVLLGVAMDASRAPRPPDTRARARRRRSASRASCRRDGGSAGSPRRGSGSAPRRRASSCRRRSSSCPG